MAYQLLLSDNNGDYDNGNDDDGDCDCDIDDTNHDPIDDSNIN
jgi:hypothetical protein